MISLQPKPSGETAAKTAAAAAAAAAAVDGIRSSTSSSIGNSGSDSRCKGNRIGKASSSSSSSSKGGAASAAATAKPTPATDAANNSYSIAVAKLPVASVTAVLPICKLDDLTLDSFWRASFYLRQQVGGSKGQGCLAPGQVRQ